MDFPLNDFARILIAVAAVLTFLFTFGMGVLEYRRQGTQKRADQFLEMRRRLKNRDDFSKICALLNKGDVAELADLSREDRLNFLGFFEELALMMHSDLIKPKVVHYMFGSFALELSKSTHYWKDVDDDRRGPYSIVFNDFVVRMMEEEKILEQEHTDFVARMAEQGKILEQEKEVRPRQFRL